MSHISNQIYELTESFMISVVRCPVICIHNRNRTRIAVYERLMTSLGGSCEYEKRESTTISHAVMTVYISRKLHAILRQCYLSTTDLPKGTCAVYLDSDIWIWTWLGNRHVLNRIIYDIFIRNMRRYQIRLCRAIHVSLHQSSGTLPFMACTESYI